MAANDFTRHPVMRTSAEITKVEVLDSKESSIVEFRYVWTIDNYATNTHSLKIGDPLRSPAFSPRAFASQTWRLIAYPKGIKFADADYVSMFIWLCESDAPKVRASFVFHVVNAVTKKVHVFRNKGIFAFATKSETSFTGCHRYIPRKSLTGEKSDLLAGKNLTIVCDVKVFCSTDCVRRNLAETQPVEIRNGRMTDASKAGLFENPSLSDLTIVVDGREFPVHRTILAAQSSAFAALFAIKSETPDRMVLPDTSYEVFREMMRHVYRGEVTNMKNVGEALLVAANKYKLAKLKALCEKSLGATIDVKNVGRLLDISDFCNAVKLKRRVINFITAHALELRNSDEFKNRVGERPRLMLELFGHFADRLNGQPTD